MSRVSTNAVSLAYAIEASLGVLPGTPVWKLLEPNAINSFGPELTTVSRNPISKDRQRKKGTITDLDSTAEFDADLTMEHFIDFSEGFCFANYSGPIKFGPQETDDVTAVTGADSFTVDDNGDLVADQLVYARGFTNAINNGLHLVDTGSTTTNLVVTTTPLIAEVTPPANATVEVCGVQGATGDIEIDADGNIASTALDFETLDLYVGQVIWVGGVADINRFGTAASPSDMRGFARIKIIATNLLTVDKTANVWVADAGAAKEIHLYFGRFLRNVSVDDADFLERSLQFEAAYQDLESVGVDGYEYALGNYCNEMVITLPLTDKATVTFGFVGTDTEPATVTRKVGADTPVEPAQTVAFNTSSDIGRLRITEVDETGLSTFFKNITLTLNNNVSPEKVLGILGAAFMNTGNFEVDIESQMLFTNKEVTAAIRANTTVTLDFSLRNDDGGLFFDFPAVTLSGGDKEFPENETVLLNTPAMAFEDPTLGTSIGISLFGYLPTS
jgi:Phage tail tube protein